MATSTLKKKLYARNMEHIVVSLEEIGLSFIDGSLCMAVAYGDAAKPIFY
jgi:hypothetical protein